MEYDVISLMTADGPRLAAIEKGGSSQLPCEENARDLEGQPCMGRVLAIGTSHEDLKKKLAAARK